MAGGTGTDVRGDRPGRSPKSPTSGNRLRAAVSCGRGRRAMADAPSAPPNGGRQGVPDNRQVTCYIINPPAAPSTAPGAGHRGQS